MSRDKLATRQTSDLHGRASRHKTILIFNFFGGLLNRGIPLYVDNLCAAFEYAGVSCRQFTCPRFLRRLPRPFLNILFVLTEQLVMPVLSIAHDRTIHSSNSVSVLGAFSKRTALVVHDFIPNNRRNVALAARYIRMTQRIYAKLGGDVIYISKSTERIGRTIQYFPRSRSFRFPNAFYRFVQMRSERHPVRNEHVLLCSGWGASKDLGGALDLYLKSGLYKKRSLHILGLAGRKESVDLFCEQYPEVAKQILVYEKIDDVEVVRAYESAAWVWVHSQKEGYGRSIAEARLCGCRVVASNISAFREQKDELTFLYADLAGFESAAATCESAQVSNSIRVPTEHCLLQSEIERFCQIMPRQQQIR